MTLFKETHARVKKLEEKTSIKLVIINTYTGSLLIAAAQKPEYRVLMSLEGQGYGAKIQRLNFPTTAIYETKDRWPRMDLHDAVVIAHPPCSCFSAQSKKKGLTDDPKFQDTLDVIEYAIGHRGCRASALMIESVVASKEPTELIFAEYARSRGYHMTRVELDYSRWVPQERTRLWTVWSRRQVDLEKPPGRGPMLADVLNVKREGEIINWQRNRMESIRAKLVGRMSARKLNSYLRGEKGFGSLAKVMTAPGEELSGLTIAEAANFMGISYTSRVPRVLDPGGLAPTLMFDSCFLYDGELLRVVDYKRIMGFPDDYVLRNGPRGGPLEWLSRGVVPAAARYVLDKTTGRIR